MTKSGFVGAMLGALLLLGAMIVTMGVIGLSQPSQPTDRISSLALGSICIAVGSVPIIASVIGIFLLARKSYRDLAVTATTVADQPLLFGRGTFQQGMSSGRGIVVCRPGFVTFVPMEPIKHLLGEMAKTMALHVVGAQEFQVLEPKKILAWIDSLRQGNPGKFDLEILQGAEQRGAITWRAAEIEVAYDAQSPAAKKYISFRSGKALICFMRKLDIERQQVAGELSQAMARRANDAAATSSMWMDE